MFFINVHKIFYVLGTLEGELIKGIFEFILFLLITYMVLSEYTRDPRRELYYLVAGFAGLLFEKLISSVVLLSVLFGELGPLSYRAYFPIIDQTMEVLALLLMVNAFLFPLFRERHSSKRRIFMQASLIGMLYIFFQVALVVEIFYFGIGHADVTNGIAEAVFTLIKIILLLYAIYFLSSRTDILYRYRYSVVSAFLVYFITPFIRLINIVFYDSGNARLFVAEHPFPLIAILLFTRVIYLKLVDKAFLRKKLRISEERYEHEKELGKLKDKFVSVVSHELRTPLTSINLYSSLLRDGKFGKVNHKQKESLSVIKKETVRLSNLINDILDLSKLEDKVELHITDFDLHAFCAKNSAYLLAAKKGVKIRNRIPKGTIIHVDPDKFQQVLINLLSNAIKYTPKGGTITMSFKSGRIFIEDTGIGIPQKDLEKIFDKFYQVEHHVTRKEGGSGLGLTIAYDIVKLHKGDIKVSSKVGKGTKFTIVLPRL